MKGTENGAKEKLKDEKERDAIFQVRVKTCRTGQTHCTTITKGFQISMDGQMRRNIPSQLFWHLPWSFKRQTPRNL